MAGEAHRSISGIQETLGIAYLGIKDDGSKCWIVYDEVNECTASTRGPKWQDKLTMEDHWCSSKWSHGCDWGWRRAHEGWRNCHGRRRGWCPSHVWAAHAHWRRATVEGLVSPSSPGSSGGCTITIAPPRAAIVVVPLSTPPPGSGGSISGVVPATCGAIRRRVVPGGGTAPGRLVATVMGPRGVLVRIG